jgi:SPP1 gp7 family putative phage head morphogenesis protein
MIVTDAARRRLQRRRRVSHFPAGAALAFQRELLNYIRALVTLVQQYLDKNVQPLMLREGRLESLRADLSPREVKALMADLYRQMVELLPETKMEEMAQRYVTQAILHATEHLRRELNAVRLPGSIGVGVELLLPPGRMHEISEARVAEIVRLIKTIPDHLSEDVERLVFEAISSGKSYRVLAQEIAELADVTQQRARAIAVDQLNRAYSAITQERLSALGVTKAIWLTAEDERTCPRCGPLHGRVFDLEDLRARGQPPLHPSCRCTIIAEETELRELVKEMI